MRAFPSGAENGLLRLFDLPPANAGHQPAALDRLKGWTHLGAALLGKAAARAERTTRRRIDWRRNLASQGIDVALSRQLGIGYRHRRQQRPRIRVLRIVIDLVAGCELDDAA